MEGVELLQSLFTRSGGEDFVPLMSQRQLDGLTDIWVVFDNQDSWHVDSVSRPRSTTVLDEGPSRELLQKGHNGSGSPGDLRPASRVPDGRAEPAGREAPFRQRSGRMRRGHPKPTRYLFVTM